MGLDEAALWLIILAFSVLGFFFGFMAGSEFSEYEVTQCVEVGGTPEMCLKIATGER